VLLYLIKKTKQTYVLAILANYVFTTTSFDLRMSKRMHGFFGIGYDFFYEKIKCQNIL
jgi:hypothetical protein